MLEGKPEAAQFQAPKELPENVQRIDDIPDAQHKLFATGVSDLVRRIESSTPEEWSTWAKTGKGMSEAAHQAGLQVKTPEELAQLRSLHENYNNLAMLALKNENIDQASVLGNKAQAANEAYASATGKGVDGRDYLSVLKQVHGEFEPPMPGGKLVETIAGQFQPSRDPRAIRAAAVQDKETGEVFIGTHHAEAFTRAFEAGKSRNPTQYTEGFVDNLNEFLTRPETTIRAEETGQLLRGGGSAREAREVGAGIENLTNEALLDKEWGTRPDVQFQPKKDKRAVQMAALRMPDGRVFSGTTHADAYEVARETLGRSVSDAVFEDGFLTGQDEFLGRQEAYKRGVELGQITEEEYTKAVEARGAKTALMIDEPLEAEAFDTARQFQPPREDFKGEQIRSPALRDPKTRREFTGLTHSHAQVAALEALGQEGYLDFVQRAVEGYTTTRDRFVDRHAASIIGTKAGQLTAQGRKAAFDAGKEGFAADSYDLEQLQPAAEAGVSGRKEIIEARKSWKKLGVASPYFKAWFGDSKVVDNEKKPRVVYHGTTHAFDAFGTKRATAESFLGKGIYFTSDPADARANYSSIGPDLSNRIERLAEQLRGETEKLSWNQAVAEAEKQLVGASERVIPAYLKMENPVILNEGGGTRFDYQYDETTNTESGPLIDLHDSILKTADREGLDGQSLWESLSKEGLDEPTAHFVGEKLSQAVSAQADELVSAPGELAGNEFVRLVFQDMGFDGVVFNHPADTFRGMGLAEGTKHYIAFDGSQVKGAENRGTFSPKDARYAFQPPRDDFKGEQIESAAWRMKDGEILSGEPSHGNLFYDAVDRGRYTEQDFGDAERGFQTTRDRFVDPDEAHTIAIAANQVDQKRLEAAGATGRDLESVSFREAGGKYALQPRKDPLGAGKRAAERLDEENRKFTASQTGPTGKDFIGVVYSDAAIGERVKNSYLVGHDDFDFPMTGSRWRYYSEKRIVDWNTNPTSDEIAAVDSWLEKLGVKSAKHEQLAQFQPMKPVDPESKEFLKWFGKSKVVDADGVPERMFHGTTDPQMDQFAKRAGLAGNFGSAATAESRLRHRASDEGWDYKLPLKEGEPLPGSATIPVYLSIKKPLRMTDVHFDLWSEMLEEIRLRLPEYDSYWEPISKLKYEKDIGAETMVVLEMHGYDGFVYRNFIEGRGTDSWIPFDPQQVKSAISNTGEFSNTDPRLQFQPGKREDWKLRAPGVSGGTFSKVWIDPEGKPIQLGP
jgi:hypothetical protein